MSNTSGSADSAVASLIVRSGPVITAQSGGVIVAAGSAAVFSVTATGTDLSYQWYYRTSPSGSWKAVSAASGKTADYSLTAQVRHDGYEYSCKVSSPGGFAESVPVSLNVVAVTSQPADVTVTTGSAAAFSVTASGGADLSYQWYYRTTPEGAWTAVSAASGKTADYSLTARTKHNGYQYKCVVSLGDVAAESGVASLTVLS